MSLDNVVCLPGVSPPITDAEAAEGLVEMLTDLLNDAKKGELTSFYGILFTADGDHTRVMAGDHVLPFEVIGALEVYKQVFANMLMDRS